MNRLHPEIIEYNKQDERDLIKKINRSDKPIIIKIKNFPDHFTIDYFAKHHHSKTSFTAFKDKAFCSHRLGSFKKIMAQINKDASYRIFGEILPSDLSKKVEANIPLFNSIPLRPRFFNKRIKTAYFFGGPGSLTQMHYDREHCCILHMCLSGKKRLILAAQSESEAIYKEAFVSNSFVDFSCADDVNEKIFPKLSSANIYDIVLEQGDMLFMPKNCWHYTEYLEPSAAVSYCFYPQKIYQFLGCFSGAFFLGYMPQGLNLERFKWLRIFSKLYAFSSGWKKALLAVVKYTLLVFLYPICCITFWYKINFEKIRWN